VEDVDTTSRLGRRFNKRLVTEEILQHQNLWGNNDFGFSHLNIPWSLNLSLTFSYNRNLLDRIDRRCDLNTGFNFTLAESWKVTTSFQYDFINEKIIVPQLSLTKDLCCWELTASWYPVGYSAGFYLRFGIKSSQLQDLKIEKRDSPLYR
jgi:hypothetical protein